MDENLWCELIFVMLVFFIKNQIANLWNKLLPCLPSKLSTVVSANEDEL